MRVLCAVQECICSIKSLEEMENSIKQESRICRTKLYGILNQQKSYENADGAYNFNF